MQRKAAGGNRRRRAAPPPHLEHVQAIAGLLAGLLQVRGCRLDLLLRQGGEGRGASRSTAQQGRWRGPGRMCVPQIARPWPASGHPASRRSPAGSAPGLERARSRRPPGEAAAQHPWSSRPLELRKGRSGPQGLNQHCKPQHGQQGLLNRACATRTHCWAGAEQHGGTASRCSHRQATSRTRPLACSSAGRAGPPHCSGAQVGKCLTEPTGPIAPTAAGGGAGTDRRLRPLRSCRPASRRRPAVPAQAFLGLKMPFGSAASSASSAAAAKEEVRRHAAAARGPVPFCRVPARLPPPPHCPTDPGLARTCVPSLPPAAAAGGHQAAEARAGCQRGGPGAHRVPGAGTGAAQPHQEAAGLGWVGWGDVLLYPRCVAWQQPWRRLGRLWRARALRAAGRPRRCRRAAVRWLLLHTPPAPLMPQADLLSGQWELLYTTSGSILGATRPALLRPWGPTYQVIDTAALTARNKEGAPRLLRWHVHECSQAAGRACGPAWVRSSTLNATEWVLPLPLSLCRPPVLQRSVRGAHPAERPHRQGKGLWQAAGVGCAALRRTKAVSRRRPTPCRLPPTPSHAPLCQPCSPHTHAVHTHHPAGPVQGV